MAPALRSRTATWTSPDSAPRSVCAPTSATDAREAGMFHRMTRSMLAALALGVAVTLAGARMLAPSAAWADASDLASAQQLYDSAKYADAVTQLKAALDGGKLSGGDAVRGRELLARCQVKAGDAAGAKKTFLALLRQDPLYRPDATQVPPDEMAAYEAAHTVAAAEQERQKQPIPASLGFNFAGAIAQNKGLVKAVASRPSPRAVA